MALSYATREEIAREPSLFTDSVAGAINTHALFRVRNLAVPEQQAQADLDLALAILADTDRYMRATLRMVLHAAEQSALEDVTALTDAQIVGMIETLWPALVQVFGVSA